jgi:hypothetical protein
MGPFTLTITDFNPATGTFDIIVDADGYVVVNNATDPETVVDETLTQDDVILINDALASIKKHDILTLEVTFGTTGFGSPQGQVDLGADGLDDYTSIRTATISDGPFELEIWPGPPGSGTIRILVTGHDIDMSFVAVVVPVTISDYSGAVLLKGPLLNLHSPSLSLYNGV